MPRRKVYDACVRIDEGMSTVPEESGRINMKARQLRRHLAAYRAAKAEGGPAAKPAIQEATPPGPTPEKASAAANPALDKALEAAGESKGTPGAPVADVQRAKEDLVNQAQDLIASLKLAAGAMIVQRYSPPLNFEDPKVQKALEPGQILTTAVRFHPQTVIETIGRGLKHPYAIWIALAVDGFLTMMSIKSIAVREGWSEKKAAEKREEESPVRGGSPESLKAQIDRAREDLRNPILDRPSPPDRKFPTSGTINAPPVKRNGQ